MCSRFWNVLCFLCSAVLSPASPTLPQVHSSAFPRSTLYLREADTQRLCFQAPISADFYLNSDIWRHHWDVGEQREGRSQGISPYSVFR